MYSRRHDNPFATKPQSGRRSGYVTLLVVGALFVVLGVTAVVVDRMWIDNASVELAAAADASALAAARTLASDETLQQDVDWDAMLDRARENAQRASDLNPVAGGKLTLREGEDGDIWFGRNVLNRETGQSRFVFTDWQPSVVKVRAERTKDNGNPVGMLLGGIFGVPAANVSTYSTVVVDNHVLGIRAGEKLPIPALPIAILASGATGTTDGEATGTQPLHSWATAIESRLGPDELRWDDEQHEVVPGSDGLPEIVVRPMPTGSEAGEANVQLLDFRSAFRFDVLEEQIEHGLSTDHLADFEDAEMLLDGRHHRMSCSAVVDARVFEMFAGSIGKPRLCFLYEHHTPRGTFGEGTLDVTRLVGVRVLAVRRSGTGRDTVTEIVLQPAVVTTKCAIPYEDWQWGDENEFRNPYVYTLTVTP